MCFDMRKQHYLKRKKTKNSSDINDLDLCALRRVGMISMGFYFI